MVDLAAVLFLGAIVDGVLAECAGGRTGVAPAAEQAWRRPSMTRPWQKHRRSVVEVCGRVEKSCRRAMTMRPSFAWLRGRHGVGAGTGVGGTVAGARLECNGLAQNTKFRAYVYHMRPGVGSRPVSAVKLFSAGSLRGEKNKKKKM